MYSKFGFDNRQKRTGVTKFDTFRVRQIIMESRLFISGLSLTFELSDICYAYWILKVTLLIFRRRINDCLFDIW